MINKDDYLALVENSNYKFCQETLDLRQNIEVTFLELGRRLYKIRESRMFEPAYSSFNEFCLELKMSQSAISKLLNIYKKFILEYGFTKSQLMRAGGWAVVAETLPVIKNRKDAKEFIEKASTMPLQHVRREVRERKSGVDQRTCNHKDDAYVLRICRRCGDKEVLEDTKRK